MIENYEKLPNGLVRQKEIGNLIEYDDSYISTYESFGEIGYRMSYLRYGHIIGMIKEIPESILDVGYGSGDFLRACTNSVKKCYGNDISGHQLPEGIEFIDDITSQHFDVITFFDSLEHFECIDFVKNLDCKYVIISVPECHYFSDEWFDSWKHRKPNEHLWHFNKESLINFMNENGFECIGVSNVEDIIRKPVDENPNILTGVFKKN